MTWEPILGKLFSGHYSDDDPGIASAITMVFMPTISSYVIADILSENKVTLFGKYIQIYFNNANYNDGSFLALIMLLLIVVSSIISKKISKGDNEGGQASIW